MGRAIAGLLAQSLPATLVFFIIGSLFLKKFKLSKFTTIIGFFAAWFISVVVSVLIAERPTANSASQSIVLAALIGSIISLVCIAIGGKRRA